MKVALVHDALVNRGGAERVAAVLCEAFPGAPLFTSVYLPERTYPVFRDLDVRPSPLLRHIRTERTTKLSLPLLLWAMRRHDLGSVDLVLSSSTFAAKFARKPAGAVHVCYCYTPFRLAWDRRAYDGAGPLARAFLALAATALRPVDRRAARSVDAFITMTAETRARVAAAYGRDAAVVPPPIDCARYAPSGQRSNRFLLVSRLEPYKRVEVAIETFNTLGSRLVVVGDGTVAPQLKAMARANIEFRGGVPDEELRELYATSRAVVFPQREDYGLVPLEANASGTPVIAYGAGGVLETMVPARRPADARRSTAVFFAEQTTTSLEAVLRAFDQYEFDPSFLREHARRFDKLRFIERVRALASAALSAHPAR